MSLVNLLGQRRQSRRILTARTCPPIIRAVLRSTERVRLVCDNGKEVWRVDSGDYMREDAVLRLVGAGVLIAQTLVPELEFPE